MADQEGENSGIAFPQAKNGMVNLAVFGIQVGLSNTQRVTHNGGAGPIDCDEMRAADAVLRRC